MWTEEQQMIFWRYCAIVGSYSAYPNKMSWMAREEKNRRVQECSKMSLGLSAVNGDRRAKYLGFQPYCFKACNAQFICHENRPSKRRGFLGTVSRKWHDFKIFMEGRSVEFLTSWEGFRRTGLLWIPDVQAMKIGSVSSSFWNLEDGRRWNDISKVRSMMSSWRKRPPSHKLLELETVFNTRHRVFSIE